MKHVLLAASILFFTLSSNASITNSDCKLTGAPTHGSVSQVKTVVFSSPVQNTIGTFERTATLNSVTVTLGEGGSQTYVTVLDKERNSYFASAFDITAAYDTSEYSLIVKCE